ncbi:MAG: hypothetical protein HYW22_00610 [Candidatus Aenigmarchaeota archaeon]|nr:hypothetical protein [Candidatus Aenigmarchaeota archaeon]
MKLIKAAVNVASISAGAGVGGIIGYAASEGYRTETRDGERPTTREESVYSDTTVVKPLEYTGPGLIVGYKFEDKHGEIFVPQTVKKDENITIRPNQTLWRITEERYLDLKTDQETAKQVNVIATYTPNVKANPEIVLDTKSVVNGRVVNAPDGILGDEIYPGRPLILPEVPKTVSVRVPVTDKEPFYLVRELVGTKPVPAGTEHFPYPVQVTTYDINYALYGALIGAALIGSIFCIGKGLRRLFSNGRGERIAEVGVVATTITTVAHEVYRLAGVLSDPDKVQLTLRNLEQFLNYMPKLL